MDGLAPAFPRDGLVPAPPLGGILYIEDFDADPAPPAQQVVTAPVSPSFTHADIDAAHIEGYNEGMEAAATDRDAVRAQLTTAAMAAIADALAGAHAQAVAAAQAMAGELAATIVGLIAAALPAASAASAGREIPALLDVLLPPLMREPALEVRVHAEMRDDIDRSLRDRWPALAPRLSVIADATLDPADVSLTWQQGEARRDMQALWRDLRAALQNYHLPSLESILRGVADGTFIEGAESGE